MSSAENGRLWIPVSPFAPDWKTPSGMIEWIAARLVEVERSVPSGDGQSIVQQIIDTELPMLREMLGVPGVPQRPTPRDEAQR